MKTRHLLLFALFVIATAVLTVVAVVFQFSPRGAGDGASARAGVDQDAAGKAVAKRSTEPKVVPLPPRFRAPAFSDVRMLPAARPGTQEYYAQILTAPVSDWAGPVPASLADLPPQTREALGPKAGGAAVNLEFLSALGRCVPSNLRGAMVVDLFFEKDKATRADVEATTLPPEHDKMLARCVAEAHVGRYLLPPLPEPDPDPNGGSTVFPLVVQLPIRNTDVYRRLASMARE